MTEPDALSLAASELSSLLLDEESLEGTLNRVATLAMSAIPTCCAAGVTLRQQGRWFTAARTTGWLDEVDRGQYDLDDGPCLRAAREQHVIKANETTLKADWGPFYRDAQRHGVSSVLALPLRSLTDYIGALNLYSQFTDGFDNLEPDVVELYAQQAGIAVRNSMVYDQAQRLVGQLQEAMASRAVIEQAKGYLMARQAVDADAAFDLLRRASQRTNRKLRDLAADILTGGPGPKFDT